MASLYDEITEPLKVVSKKKLHWENSAYIYQCCYEDFNFTMPWLNAFQGYFQSHLPSFPKGHTRLSLQLKYWLVVLSAFSFGKQYNSNEFNGDTFVSNKEHLQISEIWFWNSCVSFELDQHSVGFFFLFSKGSSLTYRLAPRHISAEESGREN